ncbi:MAG: ligase-associated DNA damage response exonuclease [Alphaproteobacteria bacterium]|nr:ligase-associated DNA damage response exonuclease [Alphaproteobacteria bacterium]
MAPPPPESWVKITDRGIWCDPGGFHIDPVGPVDRAVITHGHSDHARSGHGHVLATAPTLAIMRARYGAEAGGALQALGYGERLRIGAVDVTLVPAGHVLGSAQIILEYRGSRVVVSGDYKRRFDATCAGFEPQRCDVFITEATFGLPVFRHPPDAHEMARLLHSVRLFPERCHLIGVYALGKCQRILTMLRRAGYDEPVFLHGALLALCEVYRAHGVELGPTLPSAGVPREALKGRIVLAPPGSTNDRWARKLPDPVIGLASGWMRVKQRAKARGVELPLVVSDHADWDELLATLDDVGAPEIWVTHGREEALIHAAAGKGLRARALALLGFEEED